MYIPGLKWFQDNVWQENCSFCGESFLPVNKYDRMCKKCYRFLESSIATPYKKDFDDGKMALEKNLISKTDFGKLRDKIQLKIDKKEKIRDKKLFDSIMIKIYN